MKKVFLFLLLTFFSVCLFACNINELVLDTDNVNKQYIDYDCYSTSGLVVKYKDQVITDYDSYLTLNGDKVEKFTEPGTYKVVVETKLAKASYEVNYDVKTKMNSTQEKYEIYKYISSDYIMIKVLGLEDDINDYDDDIYLIGKDGKHHYENKLIEFDYDVDEEDNLYCGKLYTYKNLENDTDYNIVFNWTLNSEKLSQVINAKTINDNYFEDLGWNFGVSTRFDSPFILTWDSLGREYGLDDNYLLMFDEFGGLMSLKTKAQLLRSNTTNVIARAASKGDTIYVDKNYVYIKSPLCEISEKNWTLKKNSDNYTIFVECDSILENNLTIQKCINPICYVDLYLENENHEFVLQEGLQGAFDSYKNGYLLYLYGMPDDNFNARIEFTYFNTIILQWVTYRFNVKVENGVYNEAPQDLDVMRYSGFYEYYLEELN